MSTIHGTIGLRSRMHQFEPTIAVWHRLSRSVSGSVPVASGSISVDKRTKGMPCRLLIELTSASGQGATADYHTLVAYAATQADNDMGASVASRSIQQATANKNHSLHRTVRSDELQNQPSVATAGFSRSLNTIRSPTTEVCTTAHKTPHLLVILCFMRMEACINSTNANVSGSVVSSSEQPTVSNCILCNC